MLAILPVTYTEAAAPDQELCSSRFDKYGTREGLSRAPYLSKARDGTAQLRGADENADAGI